MKIKFGVLVACFAALVLVTALPLFGHHSFSAQFDASKAVRLTGVLTKVEWGNPHIYFYLDVKDEDGKAINWTFEGGSPTALSRRGFKRNDIKLGDTIIVDGYRARDGSRLVDAKRIALANGRIISGVSGDNGAPE
jgi:Family of unknown function (DUF6152)